MTVETAMTSADAEVLLIRRVAGGDGAAFASLYRAYAPRLRAFLWRLLLRRNLVEDVLDDTMFVVWRKANSYRPAAKVSSWIFAIAQRKARKALDRARRWTAAAGAGIEASESTPDSELQRSETRVHVAQALLRLPVDQGIVLRLAYMEGYACREIADLMECPVDTVKTRAFHGRRKLRAWLRRA